MESVLKENQPSNPWSEATAHPMNEVLSVANFYHHDLLPQHQVEEEFKKSEVALKLESLKNICETAADLRKASVQVKLMEIERQCHDLTRAESLQSKLTMIQSLARDLEIVINDQKLLTSKLQESYQGQQLNIEVKHHSSAIRMFQNIATSLSNLQEQLELIKWHQDHEANQRHAFDSLRSLSTQVKLLRLECQRFLSDSEKLD